MSKPRMVGCRAHVKRPYEDVGALLRRGPLALLHLLQRATTPASARAQSPATSLRVDLAGLEMSVDVRLHVRRIRDGKVAGASPALRIELAWEAIHNQAIFPTMLAELVVQPRSPRETQVEIEGAYWTPMGPLGTAFDAAVGHRIAEAVMHRLLTDLVEQLHCELSSLDSPEGETDLQPRSPQSSSILA